MTDDNSTRSGADFYWGRSNFEGLLEVADALVERDVRLEPYAKYCQLREQGLRKQAFDALRAFTASFSDWPLDEQIRLVDWLLQLRRANPDVHNLFPHPVLERAIRPTLEAWAESRPDDSAPHRWRGIIFQEPSALEDALRLNPADDLARLALVDWRIGHIYFATHHIPDYFIGNPSEILEYANETHSLLDALEDDQRGRALREDLEWYEELVRLWVEYGKEERAADFVAYCAERRFQFAPSVTVYYQTDEDDR
jgi:hypothetical protein